MGTHIAVSITDNNTCSDLDSLKFNSSDIMYNFTAADYDHVDRYNLVSFYSVSPFLYPVFGMCVTIVVGLLLSLLPCCKHKSPVSRNLMFICRQGKMKKENIVMNVDGIETQL